MSGKNIIFDDKKIQKSSFYKNKKLFNIYDIEVDKIPTFKNDFLKWLPQMTGYVKHFDSNKTMSLKVNDNRLLRKYTKMWEKVSILMNIEFDSEPVYGDNDKYIKAKVNSYGDKAIKVFKAKKENASYKYLPLIMLD